MDPKGAIVMPCSLTEAGGGSHAVPDRISITSSPLPTSRIRYRLTIVALETPPLQIPTQRPQGTMVKGLDGTLTAPHHAAYLPIAQTR